MTKVKAFVKTAKTRIYSVNVNGMILKSGCNLIGSPLLANDDFTGDCKENCLESCFNRSQCMISGQTSQGVKPVSSQELQHELTSTGKASGKASGKGKESANDVAFAVFVQLMKQDAKKEIVLQAMAGQGLSDSASKSLYSKLSCCAGACLRPNSKESTVYQTVRYCLFDGPVPTGDKSSIAFVTRFCKSWANDNDNDNDVIVC